MEINQKKAFKITDTRTGHFFGRRRSDDPVAAVHRLLANAGYAEGDYAVEVIRLPKDDIELIVSKRGVLPTLVRISSPNKS